MCSAAEILFLGVWKGCDPDLMTASCHSLVNFCCPIEYLYRVDYLPCLPSIIATRPSYQFKHPRSFFFSTLFFFAVTDLQPSMEVFTSETSKSSRFLQYLQMASGGRRMFSPEKMYFSLFSPISHLKCSFSFGNLLV